MECNVFKKTSDEWYPPYTLKEGANESNLVEVTFTRIGPHKQPGDWRVCAWGMDDMGMEKDFADEKAAWCCFLEVIGLEDVTIKGLKARGFWSA